MRSERSPNGTESIENRTRLDHPNYNTAKIGQNTEKSPGVDLLSLGLQ